MSVHRKFQPNWSSRLSGYTQHIYIYTYTHFLFYYVDMTNLPQFLLGISGEPKNLTLSF